MKFMYPAVFRRREDGSWHGVFPDLACCEAAGDTLDEALDNAIEAARSWLEAELDDDDGALPGISDAGDLALSPGDIVRNISVNIRFYDGWDE